MDNEINYEANTDSKMISIMKDYIKSELEEEYNIISEELITKCVTQMKTRLDNKKKNIINDCMDNIKISLEESQPTRDINIHISIKDNKIIKLAEENKSEQKEHIDIEIKALQNRILNIADKLDIKKDSFADYVTAWLLNNTNILLELNENK